MSRSSRWTVPTLALLLASVVLAPPVFAQNHSGGHGGGHSHGGGHPHGGHGHGGHGGRGSVFFGFGGGFGAPYYPYAYAPYPYYYPPPVYYAPPAYYAPAPAPPPPSPSWYYCDNPQGYYPYVPSCASGWRQVPARPQ